MTFSPIQLRKEARQLLLPWFLLISGGLFALLHISPDKYLWNSTFSLVDWLIPIACFLGIPLLAALPLGSEFQHGTFCLLLAQPVDRRALWLQKLIITWCAVLPAAALYVLAIEPNHGLEPDLWIAVAWMATTSAGAMAWTLIARSTIGGLALSSGVYWITFFVWSYLWDHLSASADNSAAFRWVTAFFLLAYCVAMILLGRRMFLRYQAVEGVLGNEAFAPASRFLSQVSWDWLRSRPRGAILNLVRREIQLLRVVWLLSLFSLAAWICLVAFRFIKPNDSWDDTPTIFLAVLLSFLIALLAGALSLGEEKNRGTHAWHLTLPLSGSTQWLVKLFVAIFVSIVCAVGIPLGVLLARGWLADAPFSYLGRTPVWFWALEALFTTLLAFWCSCAVKGTVRAVLAFFPMLFAAALTLAYSGWLAGRAANYADRFLDSVLFKYDLFRLNHAVAIFADRRNDFPVRMLVIVAPLLAVGLIQSYRMFRAHSADRKLHAVRCSLPLLATLFLSCFALSSLFSFVQTLWFRQQDVLREVHLAIQTLETGRADLPSVRRFTTEDLAGTSQLSDRSQRWLRHSTILVRMEEDDRPRSVASSIQWPYESAFITLGAPGKNAVPYSATIRTERGAECNLRFWASGKQRGGILTQSCQ